MTRRAKAFTLLETLLALALILVLCAAVFAFLLALGERRKGIESAGERRHALQTVLSRMSADLAGAIAGDASLGAGVVGTGRSFRVLTRSVDLDAAMRGAPESSADLLACEYRFEGGQIVASRRAVGADGVPEPRVERACDGVRLVRLRYHDGRSWSDAFDSAAAGHLPRAVEVRVWTGSAAADRDEPRGAPDELMVVAIPDADGGSL